MNLPKYWNFLESKYNILVQKSNFNEGFILRTNFRPIDT